MYSAKRSQDLVTKEPSSLIHISDPTRQAEISLRYFVTESSEHFAEYTPWFIKPGRDDLIARYKVPLDEYPKRCVEQLAGFTSMRSPRL